MAKKVACVSSTIKAVDMHQNVFLEKKNEKTSFAKFPQQIGKPNNVQEAVKCTCE